MLKSLKISNYALIEQLDLDLDKGFSTITGETGAGKSIMLGALGLLVGKRADTAVLKDSSVKSVVEGEFDVKRYGLNELFEEDDVDYDDLTIIRREIMPSGKSRAFVNDMPVNLPFLKRLGEKLIDIHSQHQNLLLSDEGFQLNAVDAVADHDDLIEKYNSEYRKLLSLQRELDKLIKAKDDALKEYDFKKFLLDELDEAAVFEDEQDELETELAQLSHAEEIKQALTLAYVALSDEERNIVTELKTVVNSLSAVSEYLPEAKEMMQRAESCFFELSDMANELSVQHEKVDVDPDRLQFVNERLNVIFSLLKKHKCQDCKELVVLHEQLKKEIGQTESFDEEIDDKSAEVSAQKDVLGGLADKLTANRKAVIPSVSERIEAMLKELGMPNVRFEIEHAVSDKFKTGGKDSVLFTFAANKNAPLRNVVETASGGELARVMLCLKAIISESVALPTIIFDEIDTGVSGDIADKMADIMQQMSSNMQVISITHLPQIASKGRSHYKVYKEDDADSTKSNIIKLAKDQRVEEIAKMLSGSVVTEAALENAKHLLS